MPDRPALRIAHRHIEVFRALMLAGSATAAAALLHTSQPTISRELARLEQLLGYALFERLQGRLRATARALRLWQEVQRSWAGLEQVADFALQLGPGQPRQRASAGAACLQPRPAARRAGPDAGAAGAGGREHHHAGSAPAADRVDERPALRPGAGRAGRSPARHPRHRAGRAG